MKISQLLEPNEVSSDTISSHSSDHRSEPHSVKSPRQNLAFFKQRKVSQQVQGKTYRNRLKQTIDKLQTTNESLYNSKQGTASLADEHTNSTL